MLQPEHGHVARDHYSFFDRTDGGYPRRYRYSATIRSSTSVTPGANQAAATIASCSARECIVPTTITVP
jgi:hypothetical protein